MNHQFIPILDVNQEKSR